MKVLGLTLAVGSLFSLNAHAKAAPQDLSDLQNRWDSVVKVENAQQFMSLENIQWNANEDAYQLVKSHFENSRGERKITNFQFAKVSENSRNILLSELFPKGVDDLAFCSSFPDAKFKLDKTLSAEEQADKKDQANFRNCKSKVKDILGGIFHMNPHIYFGEASYDDDASDLVFYVGSMTDGENFLKYEFKKF